MSWLLGVAAAIGAIVKIIEDCIEAVNSWEEFRDSQDRRAHEALKRKLEEQRDELERKKRLAEKEGQRSEDDPSATGLRAGESDPRLLDAQTRVEWVKGTLNTMRAISVKEVLLQTARAVTTTEEVMRDGGIVDRESARGWRGGERDGGGTTLASIMASNDVVLSPARQGRRSRDIWGNASANVSSAMATYGEGVGRDGGGTTFSRVPPTRPDYSEDSRREGRDGGGTTYATGQGRRDPTRRASEYEGYSTDPYGRPYNTESSYGRTPYGAQPDDPYRDSHRQTSHTQSPTDPIGRSDTTSMPDSRGGYPPYPARDAAQRYPAYATSGAGPGYPTGERDATPRAFNTDQYGRPVETLSRARSEPTWVWDERTGQYYNAANTAQGYDYETR